MNIESCATDYLVGVITNLRAYNSSRMKYYIDCVKPLCDAVYSQDLQLVYEEEQSLGL